MCIRDRFLAYPAFAYNEQVVRIIGIVFGLLNGIQYGRAFTNDGIEGIFGSKAHELFHFLQVYLVRGRNFYDSIDSATLIFDRIHIIRDKLRIAC